MTSMKLNDRELLLIQTMRVRNAMIAKRKIELDSAIKTIDDEVIAPLLEQLLGNSK